MIGGRILGMMADQLGQSRAGPPWLAPLLRSDFFGHCKNHSAAVRKHEKNHFCLDCGAGPLCPEGLTQSHAGHAAIQIRRASHRDVVRIGDIQTHLDIANIQAYTINGAKIVFLQSRPQPAKAVWKAGAAQQCDTCRRSLADQACFCSINCKLVAILASTTDTMSFDLTSRDDMPLSCTPTAQCDHQESTTIKACHYDDSIPDYTTSGFSPAATPDKLNNINAGKNRRLPIPDAATAKRRKRCTPGGSFDSADSDAHPASPISVLAPPGGTFFSAGRLHEWLGDDSRGPSRGGDNIADESVSDLPRQVHSRKQWRPRRAPFF